MVTVGTEGPKDKQGEAAEVQWQSRPGHTAVNAWVMGIKYLVVETGKVIQDSGEMILLQRE